MPKYQEKLQTYEALLKKWQGAVNLVSSNTLQDSKKRHFEDSLQLADLIPENSIVFDLGSGAGFPGMVLAIARQDLKVSLIESDTKKCTFLSTVSRETQTEVKIVNQRIEDVSRETIPDIITARALASLDKLISYSLPWLEINHDLAMILLKGGQVDAEIKEAKANYSFDLERWPSNTGDGFILRLTNIKAQPKT